MVNMDGFGYPQPEDSLHKMPIKWDCEQVIFIFFFYVQIETKNKHHTLFFITYIEVTFLNLTKYSTRTPLLLILKQIIYSKHLENNKYPCAVFCVVNSKMTLQCML